MPLHASTHSRHKRERGVTSVYLVVALIILLAAILVLIFRFKSSTPIEPSSAQTQDADDKRNLAPAPNEQSVNTPLCDALQTALVRNQSDGIRAAEKGVTDNLEAGLAEAEIYWKRASAPFRSHFLALLSSQRNVKAVEFLMSRYADSGSGDRRLIVDSLTRIAGRTALRSLLEIHAGESDPLLKHDAAEACAALTNAQYIDLLTEMKTKDAGNAEFYDQLISSATARQEITRCFVTIRDLDFSTPAAFETAKSLAQAHADVPAVGSAIVQKLEHRDTKEAGEMLVWLANDGCSRKEDAASNLLARSALKQAYSISQSKDPLAQLLANDSAPACALGWEMFRACLSSESHKKWIQEWLEKPEFRDRKPDLSALLELCLQ